MAKKRLTFKQLKFIEAYIGPAEFNCAEAARMAGYSHKSTAYTQILNIPMVEAEIRRRCLKIAPNLRMSADDITGGLCRIASDPRSPLKGGPTPVARIKALREMGLIKGLYTNKIQVTGSLTLIDLLLGASQLPDNRPGAEANAAPPLLPASAGAGPVTSMEPYDLPAEEEPMYG
jgi:hypothetical protein